MMTVKINEETLQDIINIETGLLYPLVGFMGKADFKSVVDNLYYGRRTGVYNSHNLRCAYGDLSNSRKKGMEDDCGVEEKRGFYTGSDYGCLF